MRCDYNGDDKLTAGDALLILRDAVGRPGSPKCPDTEPAAANDEAGPAGSTTSTTLAP